MSARQLVEAEPVRWERTEATFHVPIRVSLHPMESVDEYLDRYADSVHRWLSERCSAGTVTWSLKPEDAARLAKRQLSRPR